jgi:dTDP-4-amino-4,6-dideoxygalactose transaminase
MGSSFLPSEIIAAFLWAQLENLQMIQERRLRLWNTYLKELGDWANEHSVSLPVIPNFASNNAHMFYIVFKDLPSRDKIIAQLKSKSILSVFHYLSLHSSKFYANKHDGRNLPETDRYSECLLRLPMFYELDIDEVINAIKS